MASIANTLQKLVTPMGFNSAKKNTPAPASVSGLPKDPVAPTYSASKATTPAPMASQQQSNPQVKGLLSPDLNSLSSSLRNIESGLVKYQQDQQMQKQAQAAAASAPPSFGGLVGGIAEASKPTGTQTGLVTDLQKAGEGNLGIGAEAKRISAEYGGKIADVGLIGAGQRAGALSAGTQPVGQGLAAVAHQATSDRMSALAAGQDAALKGTGQQLTAQQQQQNALTSALGGANTQQQQQIGGLTGAGGLAQPQANFPFVFNPTTGKFDNQSGGQVPSPQQLAQMVMSGQATYEQAKSSIGYLGPTGESQLQAAITAAGGNPLQLQTQGAATQSNIMQTGTATTDIARAGLEKTTQDYVAMTGASQFAQNQADAVGNILQSAGLNNVSSTDYNKALNNLQSRFSSQNYAALNTALQEAQFAYSNLLSTGGSTPTANDARALSTLNINQSAAAINASIQQLENAVARRLQAKEAERAQYQSNIGGAGGNFGTAPSPQGTGTSAVGQNVEFYQKPDGSWAYR